MEYVILQMRRTPVIARQNRRVVTLLCVFHDEKTPSLKIYRESRWAKCYGCGLGAPVDLYPALAALLKTEPKEQLGLFGGDDDGEKDEP